MIASAKTPGVTLEKKRDAEWGLVERRRFRQERDWGDCRGKLIQNSSYFSGREVLVQIDKAVALGSFDGLLKFKVKLRVSFTVRSFESF